MKKLFSLLILTGLASIIARSQNGPDSLKGTGGIDFQSKSTWEEILQEAKAENKYIFVDCYASWCRPCKWMDQNVYSKDTVGMTMSKSFICIRVQMDTTSRDSEEIRNCYKMAYDINREYHINAYPSLLFFSVDGHLLHKGVGAKDITGFLGLATNALKPETQFYTVLDKYRQGDKNEHETIWLANCAKEIGEDSISKSIAQDYLYKTLLPKPGGMIWTKENLNLISSNKGLVHADDALFKRYFADRELIDSVLGGPSKSDGVINFVIYHDEIIPEITKDNPNVSEPNWSMIENTITNRYGTRYVSANMIRARVEYYKAKKKWANYSKYYVMQVESTKPMTWPLDLYSSYVLNNDAFEVFQYSFDKKNLKKAITWVDRALSMNEKDAETLDTKANLLYKLGRKHEALTIEKRSTELAPGNKEIGENYTKMKNGLPTWEVFNNN